MLMKIMLMKMMLMKIMLMLIVCQERGELSGSDGITKGGKVENRRCIFLWCKYNNDLFFPS